MLNENFFFLIRINITHLDTQLNQSYFSIYKHSIQRIRVYIISNNKSINS